MNFIKLTQVFRHGLTALFVGALLASCGGGGGSAPAGTTVISGIVSDDAISGATVTATSVDSGSILGTATTAADGSYSINAATAQIGSGYTLNSSGGTMNGLTFNGNLSAIYPVSANTQQSNLTLITSALVEAAKSTTQFSGTDLQKHEAVKTDAISRGVIASDFFLVEPSGSSGILLAAMRNQVQVDGVSATIGGLSQIINHRCGATNGICKDVSSLGESLSMSFSGATVSAPARALSSCRVIASLDAATQTLTMRLEHIPSTTANSTPLLYCKATGNVTLTLPSFTTEAPSACLAALSRGSSTPACVTVGSGITPSYFVNDGDGHKHRTDKAMHSSTPAVGSTVTFSRSYGAVLNASAPPALLAQNQWVGKTPIILVHGYSRGGGFGGDDGTWGILPQLLLEDPSYVVLNFQWITDASYLTVASELAKAVDYAYLSTGKKVHIVAHSFGGVLSRVMLQNLNSDPVITTAAAKVATLTTVGTPHSGIVKGGTLTVEGQTLPEGWGSWVPNSWCGQISCYQSGLDANLAQWAKDDLVCLAGTPKCPEGTAGKVPTRGYINARLADLINHPLPAGLKVQVLIGQIIEKTVANSYIPTFKNDDGLISYYGQRFIPQSGRNPLLSGAGVTERILGLPVGVNAFPGDPVGNIAITPYTNGPNNNSPRIGYKHSSAILGTGVFNSEVNVPANCGTGTAATCQHDTWLNLKEFLQANVAPTGINTTAGNGQATISWNAVAGVTYNLYRASVSGVTKSNYSMLPDGMKLASVTSPYVDIGLANGKTYYYVVTAVNASGESGEGGNSGVAVTPRSILNDRVLMLSQRDGNWEIYSVGLDGSNPINLTKNPANDRLPSLSPERGRIAFVSERNGNNEIYVMTSDGANPTRLTSNSADDVFPVWSPDGKKLAFVSQRDGNYEIYVMDASGGNQLRLTNTPADESFPSWSPDSKRLAFVSKRDGNEEIYVMNADATGAAVNLTNNTASDNIPFFSPDGAWISFVSNRDGGYDLGVMDTNGSNLRKITTATNNIVGWYAWSPDGTRIAFDSKADGDYEVYVINFNGTNLRQLTNNTASDQFAAWTWDGRKIVFISKRSGKDQIYAMDPDGGNPVNVSNDAFSVALPMASPIYQTGGGCFIATAAYGSYLEPEVMVLRGFRDRYLLTTDVGKVFVTYYYKWSPPVADFIKKHESLRLIVRIGLTPLVYGFKYPVGAGTLLVLLVLPFAFRKACERIGVSCPSASVAREARYHVGRHGT